MACCNRRSKSDATGGDIGLLSKRVRVIPRLLFPLCRDSTLSPSRSSILSLRFDQNVPALPGRPGRMKSGGASCLTPVPGVSCQNWFHAFQVLIRVESKLAGLLGREAKVQILHGEVIDRLQVPQADLKLLWARANNAGLSSLDGKSGHTCRMAVLTRGVMSRMWFFLGLKFVSDYACQMTLLLAIYTTDRP
jgi:hypothetical protein